jgi:hypothetical protein
MHRLDSFEKASNILAMIRTVAAEFAAWVVAVDVVARVPVTGFGSSGACCTRCIQAGTPQRYRTVKPMT